MCMIIIKMMFTMCMIIIKNFTVQGWDCAEHQTFWLESTGEGDVQQTSADETYACHNACLKS